MADNALSRRTKQRFAEQFDRDVPHDYDVTERASLLPLALYANAGMMGASQPSEAAPANAFARRY